VLHLARNATWDDGQPFTSQDVKFSIDRYNELATGYSYAFTGTIKSVQTPDNYTVVLNFNSTEPLWLVHMVEDMLVVPKHVWESFTDNQTLSYSNEPLVGDGQFKLDEWKRGAYVKLEVNKDYWLGRSYPDEVVFNYYPEPNTMVAALKAGELDMAYRVPPAMAVGLRNDTRFTLFPASGSVVRDLEFNVADPASYPKQTGNLALKDQRVRWAVSNAIDRNQLNQIVQYGYATVAATEVCPCEGKWWDPNIQYKFDLNYANQVLDQAGYTDRDPDGVRKAAMDIQTNLTSGKPFVVPKGTRLEFRLTTISRLPEEERTLEMIRDWWAKIGVKADVSVMDDTTLMSQVMMSDFDIIEWGWGCSPDPEAVLMSFWTPMSLGPMMFWTGYTSPTYDKLYQQQDVEPNVTMRQQIVWQMQELMYRDAFEVGIYAPPEFQAYNNQTTAGWIPNFGGLLSQFTLENWRSVHLVTAAPPQPSAAIGWETWTAVAVAIIIVVAIMGYYIRRRAKTPKQQ